MGKKILVTGGAGYIGSHMARLLKADGHDVIIYDNLGRGNADAANLSATLIEGDIADKARLSPLFQHFRFDAVFHFAGLAYVSESVSSPDIYYQNNVAGTLNLLDTMRDFNVNQLVFSSTCATYGIPNQLPITEATPQKPINPYGQSKLMVEQMLKDYATAYNFRSIALRYFNAAGSAEDGSLGERHSPETHLLPLVLFEALRIENGGNPEDTALRVFGDDFDTRDGTCIRDYIHVTDLCTAHQAALQRMLNLPDAGAEQFNLGTNKGYTVLEVIEACRKITGINIQYKIAARRDGDPPELVADANLAMQALDWKPAYPDIEQSLQHAWDWFSKNPPEYDQNIKRNQWAA